MPRPPSRSSPVCAGSPPGCRSRRTRRPDARASFPALARAAMRNERRRLVGQFQPERLRSKCRRAGLNLAAARFVHGIRPRQRDDVRPGQAADRLAQQAPRQQMLVAERLQRVEEHNIQVARDPPMLERVVQEQHVRRTGFQPVRGQVGNLSYGRQSLPPPPRGRDSADAPPPAAEPPVRGLRR